VDSSRLLHGLGANGAWPSLAAAARVPAEGRNGLSSLSHDKQLGSNGISEKRPVEAGGGPPPAPSPAPGTMEKRARV